MKYKLRDSKWLDIEINSLFVKTIQEFFDNYIPSRKIQHLLIQNKNILLDGNAVKREDDIVGLTLSINIYPNTHDYKILKNKIDVVYEDEIILVVNKPKDLLVHSDGTQELCLTDMVESYYMNTNYVDVQPIHRLDKETSGLVIYSKTSVFQPLLDKLLFEKQIRRNYMAFVKGVVEPDTTFVINKAIGNDRHNSNKKIIYKNGQKAITKVRSLACNHKLNYSVLLCSLDTGRTHQIRLHLSNEGYPILNDNLYGVKSKLCSRMGLCASNIEMYHPLKEDNIEIDVNLPKDLDKIYMEAI